MDSRLSHRHKQQAPWQQNVEEALTQRTERSQSRTTPFEPSEEFLRSLTPFQLKFNTLEHLKKTSLAVMARFNNLQLNYTDWFKRQVKTFVDLMKSIQIANRQLAPQKLVRFKDLRQLHYIALTMSKNTKTQPYCKKFDDFISFWNEFSELMMELRRDVIIPLEEYCVDVGRLRQPEVKEQLDYLHSTLTHCSTEDYDFSKCHNEKDHLFIYGLNTSDTDFIGLLGFIPFLIGYATKVCYLVTNVHLETLKS